MTQAIEPNLAPFPGTDRFAVLRELGSGGMGIVFEAEDLVRRSRVALKTLHRLNPTDLYRFKKEFRSLQSLIHPSLVTLYEFFSDQGRWFFTMELVEGTDFLSYVRGAASDVGGSGMFTLPRRPRRQTETDVERNQPAVDSSGFGEIADAAFVHNETESTERGARGEGPGAKGPSACEASEGEFAADRAPGEFGDGPACDLGRLRAVMEQIAGGLHYLHESGMLHRDLKPSNVLVTPGGRVAILDFGLITEVEGRFPAARWDTENVPGATFASLGAARALAQTDKGLIVGTVRYMAPEQAEGLPLSRAADWYSFGVMLYEALVGALPYSGETAVVLEKKRFSQVLAPDQLRPGIPEELSSLCIKLLKCNPTERPTYTEIVSALAQGGQSPAQRYPVGRYTTEQPFVGRESELCRLSDAYHYLREGGSVVVLVHGRSGSGKTALIQRFLDEELDPERELILKGRCFEQESVPFKAVDSLVDSLSRYLMSRPVELVSRVLPRDVRPLSLMFPVLKRVESIAALEDAPALPPDPLELRRRAFRALRHLLRQLGGIRPTVLWIDDLQWGDLDSALLLTELFHGPQPPRILLLASYRSEYEGANPCLKAFSESGRFNRGGARVERLEVGPLDPSAAEQLVEILLRDFGVYEAGHAASIVRESARNPYLIGEIVRHTQASSKSPEGVSTRAGGVSLQEMVWSRIQRLPEQPRRLLEVVAVAGQPLSQKCAYLAGGIDVKDQASLRLLRNERLLRSAGPGIDDDLEVYHDQIGETLRERLGVDIRCEHHRRLALELESGGRTDCETLAFHFAHGDQPSRAGRYFHQAALQAVRAMAFDRAADLFRQAIEIGAWPFPTEGRLKGELGDALANSRRGREAGHIYLEAAKGVPERESIDLRRRGFQQLLTSGEHDLGIAEMRGVFEAVGLSFPETPGKALLSAALGLAKLRLRGLELRERRFESIDQDELLKLDVGWSGGMSICLIDPARAAQIFMQNLHHGLRAGDLYRAARPLLAVASLLAVRGRGGLRRSSELLRQAERWIAGSDDPNLLALFHMVKGLAAYARGRWSESLKLNDQSSTLFRDRGNGMTISLELADYYSLRSLCWLGEFVELRRRRRALLKEAEQRQDLLALTNYRTEVMSYDLLADDDPTGARHEIDDAMNQWPQRAFHAQHLFALVGNLRVDLYRGEGGLARRRIADAWCAYRWSQLHRSAIGRVNVDLLIASSALASWPDVRDRAALSREATAAADRIDRERLEYASALAAMLRARLASLRGEKDSAIRVYTKLVQQFGVLEMPLYAAATQFRLGELTSQEEGRGFVRAAIDWCHSQQIKNPDALLRMSLP
jgi:serine/threonine protein kinase